MSLKNKKIAYAIIKHLQSQLDKNAVEEDDRESLEGKACFYYVCST